jgi:hypothetical protein
MKKSQCTRHPDRHIIETIFLPVETRIQTKAPVLPPHSLGYMPVIVPKLDDRPVQRVFKTKNAEAGRAQAEELPVNRRQTKPAGSQHAKKMTARKYQDVAVNGTHALDHPVSPDGHLLRRFTTRATIPE